VHGRAVRNGLANLLESLRHLLRTWIIDYAQDRGVILTEQDVDEELRRVVNTLRSGEAADYPGTLQLWNQAAKADRPSRFVCVHCGRGPEDHGASDAIGDALGIERGMRHLICRPAEPTPQEPTPQEPTP
jgi:hypothetical protein